MWSFCGVLCIYVAFRSRLHSYELYASGFSAGNSTGARRVHTGSQNGARAFGGALGGIQDDAFDRPWIAGNDGVRCRTRVGIATGTSIGTDTSTGAASAVAADSCVDSGAGAAVAVAVAIAASGNRGIRTGAHVATQSKSCKFR